MHYILAKSILTNSGSMNLNRGCTHGCIYCDSRSECYQITHDFEDVAIKENAIELLEQTLRKRRKKMMIGTGSMSDPYIDIEQSLKNTRKTLEIVYKYGYGIRVHTKSDRVLRDIDLLKKINERSRTVVEMTLTTFDEDVCKKLEPNVSTTKERFEALKAFRDNGIDTVVWLTPILPYINDTLENIDGILDYCIEAKVKGIVCFGMGLTLRKGNREYFYKKLDQHFPGLKKKYIYEFGNSYEVTSKHNDDLMRHIVDKCKKNNIMVQVDDVFSFIHSFPKDYTQLTLF